MGARERKDVVGPTSGATRGATTMPPEAAFLPTDLHSMGMWAQRSDVPPLAQPVTSWPHLRGGGFASTPSSTRPR